MGMIPFEPGEADPRDPLVDALAGRFHVDSSEQEGEADGCSLLLAGTAPIQRSGRDAHKSF